MQLQHQEQPQEARYDLETIGKVTRLAERLQSRDKDTWSAEEVEAMGAEVGLKPEFIREALGKVEEERKTVAPKPVQKASPEQLKAWRNAWWAGGWMTPLLLFGIANFLGLSEVTQGMGLFLGPPIYVGIGVYLSSIVKNASKATAPPFSRDDMLRTLEQYRAANEPREVTVLSAAPAVTMSSEELETFQEWIRASCRAFRSDGEVVSGGVVEICFRSAEDAAGAARALQEALDSQASLTGAKSSGRLKCGLATGFEFDRVRQDAAALRQSAAADDILVDRHTAGGALPALDHLTELPGKVAGGTVYSWRTPRAT